MVGQQRAPAPLPATSGSMQAVVELGLTPAPERSLPPATSRAEEEKHSHHIPDKATPLLFQSPRRQSPWRPKGPLCPDISHIRRPPPSVRSPDPLPDRFPLAPWGLKQDHAEGGPAVKQLQRQTPGPVLPAPPPSVPDVQSLVSAPRCLTEAPPPYLRYMAPPVFQQPIAAHRVVSSVGQQAAVDQVLQDPNLRPGPPRTPTSDQILPGPQPQTRYSRTTISDQHLLDPHLRPAPSGPPSETRSSQDPNLRPDPPGPPYQTSTCWTPLSQTRSLWTAFSDLFLMDPPLRPDPCGPPLSDLFPLDPDLRPAPSGPPSKTSSSQDPPLRPDPPRIPL
ncbi:unnamed protein product [Gadus morhua 'NCC']